MKFKRNADRIERKGRSRFLTIGMAVFCIFILFWINSQRFFITKKIIKVACLGHGVYTIDNDTTKYADFASKMIEQVKSGKDNGWQNDIQVYLGNYQHDAHFTDIIMILNALNVTYRLIH